GLPVRGALAEHVERAPRDAEPTHAVVDASRVQPPLRDQEALTLGAQAVLHRNAGVLVQDLSVPTELPELILRVLHGRDIAQDVHARRVGWDDEHRRTLVRS